MVCSLCAVLSRFRHVSLCSTMDCSLQAPLNSLARILEGVALPFSREFSQPRDGTHVSMSPALASGFFTTMPPVKPLVGSLVYPEYLKDCLAYNNSNSKFLLKK